jgi:hypothetical protein
MACLNVRDNTSNDLVDGRLLANKFTGPAEYKEGNKKWGQKMMFLPS